MDTMLFDKACQVLTHTSRTFSIPIFCLPPVLQEAVMSAYLCMRAIDEIEDHPILPTKSKVVLLRQIRRVINLQDDVDSSAIEALFRPYATLPEVTLRIHEWSQLCPTAVRKYVVRTTAMMADGMAYWTEKRWRIVTHDDLANYSYYVAGIVGELLSDLWKWYAGIHTDQRQAIAFGQGLQMVNIIRNREEDLQRGVDFFPTGWSTAHMIDQAYEYLAKADAYATSIAHGAIRSFCLVPLQLAYGTLQAIQSGKQKLSRSDVTHIVDNVERVSSINEQMGW